MSGSLGSNSTISIASGLARVATTAFVCGCKNLSIKKTAESAPLNTRRAKVMASAAAVDSSSIEAFAIGSAVKSQTAV